MEQCGSRRTLGCRPCLGRCSDNAGIRANRVSRVSISTLCQSICQTVSPGKRTDGKSNDRNDHVVAWPCHARTADRVAGGDAERTPTWLPSGDGHGRRTYSRWSSIDVDALHPPVLTSTLCVHASRASRPSIGSGTGLLAMRVPRIPGASYYGAVSWGADGLHCPVAPWVPVSEAQCVRVILVRMLCTCEQQLQYEHGNTRSGPSGLVGNITCVDRTSGYSPLHEAACYYCGWLRVGGSRRRYMADGAVAVGDKVPETNAVHAGQIAQAVLV